MPEGPEILVNASFLKKNIKGLNFTKITSNTKSVRNLPKRSKVLDVTSYGKIIIIITKDYYVHVHFGISGWIVEEKPRIYKYILHFGKKEFYIQDRRRFSSIAILNQKEHCKIIEGLGIDILSQEFTFPNFLEKTVDRKVNICSFLLDQKNFAGLGNYIRNEALYISKISPFRTVNQLDTKELLKLFKSIKFVSFSNVVEWFDEYELRIPKKIKKLIPSRIKVPYQFYVYQQDYDKKKK